MTERAADDYGAIRDRLEELRKEREAPVEPLPPRPEPPWDGAYFAYHRTADDVIKTCASCASPLVCVRVKRCRVMS